MTIEIPLALKPILWTMFFGWCWFMLKWSDKKFPGSNWVGRGE